MNEHIEANFNISGPVLGEASQAVWFPSQVKTRFWDESIFNARSNREALEVLE